jgi:YVTN family beta-propeller protein
MNRDNSKKATLLLIIGVVLFAFWAFDKREEVNYLSPTDIVIDKEGSIAYVAEKTAFKVDVVDLSNDKIKQSLATELTPKAIAINNGDLIVVTSYSRSELIVADKITLEVKEKIAVGSGACDIVIHPNKNIAYIANQYSNDISIVDLNQNKEIKRIDVLRQPMTLDISNDGKYLFVANFLTAERADVDTVVCKVSVIDTETEEKIKDIALTNGSNALRGMKVSNDGKYVLISHNLGRFQVPTSQLEQGWMNTSALSIIDIEKLELEATLLLDEPENGAAGSWGIDCSEDHIVVAHSGTHDFSLIDYKALVQKLSVHPNKEELSYDLRFLSNIRQRINSLGNGPRAIAINGKDVFIANYFSDNIAVYDISSTYFDSKTIALNPAMMTDSIRLGEMYFNDASYCFQQWQSCTGCHPNDARTDGLNWDLLNDGMGNSKNCKSMLYSHVTAPAMITGIRPTAEIAVRAGFRHIQFAQVSEEKARAVDYYLKSLKAVPSPYLVDGELSEKATRGKELFFEYNCQMCHPKPYYTDLQMHDIGQKGEYDHQNIWDTPTLREVWRSGPYLHDGRSATIKEVFTTEKHGIMGEPTDEEIEALTEYVLSL